MEVFSVPRVGPKLETLGLSVKAYDITLGLDLLTKAGQDVVWGDLCKFRPAVAILSPPCRDFSQLVRLWNHKKMSPSVVSHRMEDAETLLKFSMKIAAYQHFLNNGFIFEHPAGASSWKHDCVQSVAHRPGIKLLSFHQCRFGLQTPFSERPIKKLTHILTNMASVVCRFDKMYCCCAGREAHCKIQGSEAGVRLSTWAEKYPPKMCQELAWAVWAFLDNPKTIPK